MNRNCEIVKRIRECKASIDCIDELTSKMAE